MNELLSRLDYSGISILIMGSSFPIVYYVFSCGEVFVYRYTFLAIITTNSLLTFVMMLVPFMNKPKWRMCRAISFILLGLSAGLPFIFVEINKRYNERFYLPSENGMPWLTGGFVYIGGALIYGFRLPERFFPFKFDLIGSSHQIFHMAVLGGFTI